MSGMKVGEQLQLPGKDNAGMRMSKAPSQAFNRLCLFLSCFSPLRFNLSTPGFPASLSRRFIYCATLTGLAVLGGRVALTGGKAGRMVELDGGGRGRRKKTEQRPDRKIHRVSQPRASLCDFQSQLACASTYRDTRDVTHLIF